MAENQYAPLTQAVIRTLTDKLYEKRKAAALEIEKQAKELIKANNMAELEKIIAVLEQLTQSPNGNMRKGGLIGLAATAIALGTKNAGAYSAQLLDPVIAAFSDQDSRVRYFACEALYNIVKICRSSALVKFDELFNILWNLASDPDQNVRNGSELMDRLLKEIVVSSKDFDLENLMLIIRERIYTVNSSNKRFIISWLYTTLTVPDFYVDEYFQEILDGVFKALEDPSPAVREITLSVLTEMQHKLNPKRNKDVNLEGIINVLVVQASSLIPIVRDSAIQWLNQINLYYEDKILPQLSAFLFSILPYLDNSAALESHGTTQGQTALPNQLNQRLTEQVKPDSQIPVDSTVEVLLAHLRHERIETRMATLNWIRHLHSTQPGNMFRYMDRFFPVLLDLLSDPADDVLMLDIILITDICGQPKQQQQLDIRSLKLSEELSQELKSVSPYLVKFNLALLKMFKDDPKLVAERGIQIVRQVCLLLDPLDVFRTLSLLLGSMVNLEVISTATPSVQSPTQNAIPQLELEFIAKMVQMLNQILMTTSELFPLRQRLRNPEQNDSVELFQCMYKCWSHQPICLFSLYLLSQNYQPALELIPRLSDIDITLELLIEIDRIVQLIESPILAYVRMDLLHPDHQKPLTALLSALLMLLPQSEAFSILNKRLQAVPHLAVLESLKKMSSRFGAALQSASPSSSAKIKFKELIQHFDKVTQIRIQAARAHHKRLLEAMARQKLQ